MWAQLATGSGVPARLAQATTDPLDDVVGLAREIPGKGGTVYERVYWVEGGYECYVP
jgi:hypothetical protein